MLSRMSIHGRRLWHSLDRQSKTLSQGMHKMQDTQATPDVIDQILGIGPGDALHALRHARDKVVSATQSFHELAFHALGLSDDQRRNRFLVATLLADA